VEEGPGSASRGSEEDLPGGEPGGGRKTLAELAGAWGTAYPKVVERWETKAYALLAFLRHPKPIRRDLYTANLLERLAKEANQSGRGLL